MHQPTQQGDYLVPHSSAACNAIAAACSADPALAKMLIAALSVVPEQRPSLEELAGGVEAALLRARAERETGRVA